MPSLRKHAPPSPYDDLLPMCSSCGKIMGGPDKGKKHPDFPDPAEVAAGRVSAPGTYKGQHISHTTCEDCSHRMVEEMKRRKQQGL